MNFVYKIQQTVKETIFHQNSETWRRLARDFANEVQLILKVISFCLFDNSGFSGFLFGLAVLKEYLSWPTFNKVRMLLDYYT